MDNRTTEEIVLDIIDNINKAGYDTATRKQIERWYQELEDLGGILAKLLRQGKIRYSRDVYSLV